MSTDEGNFTTLSSEDWLEIDENVLLCVKRKKPPLDDAADALEYNVFVHGELLRRIPRGTRQYIILEGEMRHGW